MKIGAVVTVALLLAAVTGAGAGDRPQPTGLYPGVRPMEAVPVKVMPPVDVAAALAEDAQKEAKRHPLRFALPVKVKLSPEHDGQWETVEKGLLLWRLRIISKGALSLNLGFSHYFMPPGGRLLLYSPDLRHVVGPFTEKDNSPHGELWTPTVKGDEVVVEVTLPSSARDDLELDLTSVNHDYKGFVGKGNASLFSCERDVVCSLGNAWRDQIRAVAVYSLGGGRICSGAMVNNTAQDGKPYFLTAHHCGVTGDNAASVVTYWNFESAVCRYVKGQANAEGDIASLDQFETGAVLRGDGEASDFTLIELDNPPHPAYHIFWAGWDRTSGDPPCSPGAPCAVIHHANIEEKRITLSDRPMLTTSFYGQDSPGDGTHLWVHWERDAVEGDPIAGVTESGSSGSPLFNAQGRIVGQLQGGDSSCAARFEAVSDYFGRLSVSWAGGGTPATRLSDWLDPLHTGAATLDGRNGPGR